jgi:Fe2+ transport system protein B
MDYGTKDSLWGIAIFVAIFIGMFILAFLIIKQTEQSYTESFVGWTQISENPLIYKKETETDICYRTRSGIRCEPKP